jgi:L-amino acid N-acyltransferase YncA
MIEAGNDASVAVARKLGFVEYGQHRLEDGVELVLWERH